MSIQTAIQNAQTKVANAYTAVNNKGGTLPATQDLSNLPSAISSIPEATVPTLATLTVTPSTTSQTITPTGSVDGYNTVKVSAVTASIDSDIVASNIKSGVNILGVTGSVTELVGETRTVSITSTSGNTFTPSSGKNGITSIKCNPTNKALTITPSTTTQTTTVPTNYSGHGTVTTNAVTSAIDANITAGNIKKDVNILGVIGTYEGSGGVGITREVSANGLYRMPSSNFTFSLPSNATDVGAYAMAYAFYNCSTLTSVDLSNLTTVSGSSAMYYAFNSCTNLTSVDLSNLTTVSGPSAMYYAFYSCTNLTSVDLSNLTTLSVTQAMNGTFNSCTRLTSVDLSSLTTVSGQNTMYYAFYGCTRLTSVDLSSLTTVSSSSVMSSAFYGCSTLTSVIFTNLQTIGANTSSTNYSQFNYCFYDCNNLTSITFPNLEKIYCTGGTSTSYGTFANNNKIQKLYFPKLDTITYGNGASSSNQQACKNVFYGCSSLTELHFGAANQSAIEASPGYSTAWGRGAGNVTIYFDL